MPCPPTAFSDWVTSPGWRAEADEWVSGELARAGLRVTGPPEQRRTRPWSTQVVTPTTDGPVWFKANCPGLAAEPALHEALARLAPDRVDAPLATDPSRGWMLTRDRGPTLADRHEPTLDEWCEVAREAADLQRRAAAAPAEVVASGLLDCSPQTVPARYDQLLDRYAAFDATHPSHLTAERRAQFEAVRPEVADAAETLRGGALPVTVNHGDLHPGNVFVVDGGLRLFDFGDAQWSCAPEVLGAFHAWLTHRTEHPWEPVVAAYAEVWSDLAGRTDFDVLLAAAMVTLPVNRSATWWASTLSCTPTELAEWGSAPLSQLSHVLRPWP